MSRNLGQTHCDVCGYEKVALLEDPRPITKKEAGPYFDEFEGLDVALGWCPVCEAQYLAWVSTAKCKNALHRRESHCPDGCDYFDLSYRSSFNDEPGDDDVMLVVVGEAETVTKSEIEGNVMVNITRTVLLRKR